MKPCMIKLLVALSVCVFIGFGIVASNFADTISQTGLAIVSTQARESKHEEIVREYFRNEILKDENALTDSNDTITFVYGSIDLNDSEDFIAIVSSHDTCGSGGCIATLFLVDDTKTPLPVKNFSYAVHSIRILESTTQGMHDLELNGSKNGRMTWDGTQYIPTSI